MDAAAVFWPRLTARSRKIFCAGPSTGGRWKEAGFFGWRVSAATAVVGTMLQIKPILHVDDEGHLIKTATARGRRGSLDALMDRIGELATDPSQQVVFLSHTDSHDEAIQMASDIKARYGVKEVIVNHIGPVIGAHTGPGCIALFFMGKHR